MNPSLALNPDLNVRCFTAPTLPSAVAASQALPGTSPGAFGALSAVLENLSPEAAARLDELAAAENVIHWVSGARSVLTGPYSPLRAVAHSLGGSEGAELRSALRAFYERPAHPGQTLVMGVLNVTPDSFSDGGLWLDHGAAVERGLRMAAEGAKVLDIGGESTRPGASEVPEEEELRRILPVIRALRSQTEALLSIDTRKAGVAERCLEAGADWINDVSGLAHNPRLAEVAVRKPGTKLVLMHSRARPADERFSTEYDADGRPVYEDVVADTMRWLRRQMRVAVEAGVPAGDLWIDPGFGFGKTYEQNVELLRRLREYTSIGAPILVGTSRKSSVGRLLGDLPPDERLEGTMATVAWAVINGAAAVRVHDVKEHARLARVLDTLGGAAAPGTRLG